MSETGHHWPCTRFYVTSSDRDPCTCGQADGEAEVERGVCVRCGLRFPVGGERLMTVPDPTTDDVRVEPVARVLWDIARSEYDYDWDSNADTLRDQARQVLAAADATERDARVRDEAAAEALTKAADAWQQGAWINAPHRADPVAQRVANGQFVAEWLRARVEGGESL